MINKTHHFAITKLFKIDPTMAHSNICQFHIVWILEFTTLLLINEYIRRIYLILEERESKIKERKIYI